MTTTETDKETATEMKNAKDDKDRGGERARETETSRQTVQIHVRRHVRLEAESTSSEQYLIKIIRWGG